MARSARKTKRRARRTDRTPDYSATAEHFRRHVAPLPADWDATLPVDQMYRHMLTGSSKHGATYADERNHQ